MTSTSSIDPFQRTASYWQRRAFRWLSAGDAKRAAVLFRHAMRLEPSSLETRMGYAMALRELNCYEASTREAVAALAYDASQYHPYRIISLNMYSIGLKQEAFDAMALYLEGSYMHYDDIMLSDTDLYESEEIPYDLFERPPSRGARMEGLLSIAAKRIAKGDLPKAKAALAQANVKPYQHPSAQHTELTALYYEKLGKQKKAIEQMEKAMKIAPRDCQIASSAASMFWRQGETKKAYLALLRAAVLVRYPLHELMVCVTAEQMDELRIAHLALRALLQHAPHRQTTCYNLCVCHLKAGELKEASGYIHLCREIDTDDVQIEALFLVVEQMEADALDRESIKAKAKSLSFYGMLRPDELYRSLNPLIESLDEGMEVFAARILDDVKFYNRFLYALSLPIDGFGEILPALCEALPPDFAQRLLRHALFIDPKDAPYKKIAAELLADMGAPSPYIIWHEGHIIAVDPSLSNKAQPRLIQKLLYRQIRLAVHIHGDTNIIPFILEMVTRMNRAQRLLLASDRWQIWPLALCLKYSAPQNPAQIHGAIDRLSITNKAKLERALQILRSLTISKEEQQ